MLIRDASQLPNIAELPRLPRPDRLLLVEPEFYDVEYVINPHMAAYVEGVDRLLARQQWLALRRAYEQLSIPVEVLPGEPFLPDFVFCANQALPVPPGVLGEGAAAVMSIMSSSRRQPEIRPFAAALESRGLHLEYLDPYVVRSFEGTGDGSWHPERALLLGGVGPRSTTAAYDRIQAWMDLPVVVLELTDPRFYHLDTCLSPIDGRCAVFFPGAFTEQGVELIRAIYPDAIEVQEAEAVNMVCNGHCPDGQHFLVHPGSPSAEAAIEDRGLEIVNIDTSEYLKSGGSVFCMKLHYWAS